MSVETEENSKQLAKKVKCSDEEVEDSKEKQIELSYDVLRVIFSNLLPKDVYNCALVSRLWKDAAMFELHHRGVVEGLGTFNDLFVENNPKKNLSNQITNRPMLSFLCTTSQCSHLTSFFNCLPSTCLNISINNYGLVCNNTEHEIEENLCSYLLLPEDRLVDIEVIAGTISRLEQINRKIKIVRNDELSGFNSTHIETLLSNSLKRLKHFKCMILFATEKFIHEKKLIRLKSFKKHVKTFWGGITKQIIVHKRNNLNEETRIECSWLMLMISGRNVRTWSTFLAQSDKKEEDVVSKLTKLKERVCLLKHSVGFMFACIARGAEWYKGAKNVESTIFKQIFPNVPLIGSFGNGEFGSHFENPKGLHLQYSTAFMIVTYG